METKFFAQKTVVLLLVDKRPTVRLPLVFKRSLNVILVGGSQFYSLLLRGSLKTKETSLGFRWNGFEEGFVLLFLL